MHYIVFFISIIFSFSLMAVQQQVSVQVPKTAYVQWLPVASAEMSQAADTVAHFEFTGQMKEQNLYLGIMCNSLNGYEVIFVAEGAVDAASADARGSDGSTIVYSGKLDAEGWSLRGAVPATSLDFTGAQPSIRVTFPTAEALPLMPYQRNVFKLTLTTKDAVPQGPYYGRITAIVRLP